MNVRISSLALMAVFVLAAQPPPPGGREEVRRHLAGIKPTDETTRSITALAQVYLARSEDQQAKSPFAATRFLAAADALIHAAEHQQHLSQNNGPPPPDKPEVLRRLERVYFRLQQADYFVEQSADSNAKAIAGFARMYYQKALRAGDGPDSRTADECGKSAEELVRALESLAQATAPPPRPARGKP